MAEESQINPDGKAFAGWNPVAVMSLIFAAAVAVVIVANVIF